MSAQHRLSTAVNSAMVTTYWEIGEQIFKACGENDRAECGKILLEYLSEQLTAEFGKGIDCASSTLSFGTWKRIFLCSTPKEIYIGWTGFFIDLVFYNYILKCFVLVDLKMGKLTHQDLGQMQMYVNYYTREMMNEGDTQPIGIVLCADKGDSIVKYTLPEDNHQIFASKYFTYLPSEEELKRELELK